MKSQVNKVFPNSTVDNDKPKRSTSDDIQMDQQAKSNQQISKTIQVTIQVNTRTGATVSREVKYAYSTTN